MNHVREQWAETTLLILASTVALLGLFNEIPFAQASPPALWELKVSVLAMTFVHAFFKLT